jgi:hypothetical protein
VLDEEMVRRQEDLAAVVAETLRDTEAVLAVDLGDEIGNVSPQPAPSRADVAAWHRRLAAAVRKHLPGVLVTQANDASGVLGSSPFGADNSAALDLIACHGFPTWSPGSIESTSSYKATSLPSFLVRFAAAYGVPFVDELGSYGVDEQTSARYLRAAGAACLANGASGVVAWCWQDIASEAEPYRERPTERLVGLRGLDGTPKPAFAELRRLAAGAWHAPRRRAPIALYVPDHVRPTGTSYLDAGAGTLATFYAYLLLKRAHLEFDVVRDGLDGYRLVLCPSVTRITLPDLERLHGFLGSGGTLYYSMDDHLHGFPGADLAGAELVDYTLVPEGKTTLCWDGDEWPIDWHASTATTVRVLRGQPAGHYPDGTPALVVHETGGGRVLFCAAPVERQLDVPGRLDAGAGDGFYRRVAALAGIRPEIDCGDPRVEVVPDARGRVIVVNHAPVAVSTTLRWRSGDVRAVRLETKDWCVVEP